jgi:hypothetical protein
VFRFGITVAILFSCLIVLSVRADESVQPLRLGVSEPLVLAENVDNHFYGPRLVLIGATDPIVVYKDATASLTLCTIANSSVTKKRMADRPSDSISWRGPPSLSNQKGELRFLFRELSLNTEPGDVRGMRFHEYFYDRDAARLTSIRNTGNVVVTSHESKRAYCEVQSAHL